MTLWRELVGSDVVEVRRVVVVVTVVVVVDLIASFDLSRSVRKIKLNTATRIVVTAGMLLKHVQWATTRN